MNAAALRVNSQNKPGQASTPQFSHHIVKELSAGIYLISRETEMDSCMMSSNLFFYRIVLVILVEGRRNISKISLNNRSLRSAKCS